MTSSMSKFFALLSVVLFTLPTFATVEDDYAALKDAGVDLSNTGSICEEVARLRTIVDYPAPAYRVITGIAYGDSDRTIGELDVIVFDTKSNNVVKVGEVKCWRNLGGGLKKAREQRRRFLSTLKEGRPLHFESTSTPETFRTSQFKGVTDFVSIAQQGGKAAGYDLELDLPLSTLMELRARIMTCQERRECKPAVKMKH